MSRTMHSGMRDRLARAARTARVFSLALLWSVLTASIAACASGGAKESRAAADYQRLYERREYAKAYEAASAAYGNSPPASRERAALVAGLSAAALQRTADAERWLRPLVSSPDDSIAGSAGATLGVAAQKRGAHPEAAKLLTAAVPKLGGDDRAWAAMYAGDSLQAMGRRDEAVRMYEQARDSVVRETELRVQVNAKLAVASSKPSGDVGGLYTVQLGSYSDWQRANAQAVGLRAKAAAAGLPTPRVATVSKDGRTLYAVRIGRFGTRVEGEAAMRKLGQPGAAVMVAHGE